jgi:hypothetical protein
VGYRVTIDLGFDLFGLNRMLIGQASRLRACLDEQLGTEVGRRGSRLTIAVGSRYRAEQLRRAVEATLQNRLLEAKLSIDAQIDNRWQTLRRTDFRPALPFPGDGEAAEAPPLTAPRR